jgi:hypothetical protein
MEQNEFLKKILDLDVGYYSRVKSKNSWHSDYYAYKSPKFDKKTGEAANPPTLDDVLHHEWVTGGVSGGSCWDQGESRHYPRDGQPEPDFTELDNVLESLCPNLSFLQYKKLASAIIKVESRTEDEYYGNSTTYSVKLVRLGDLYDKLKELKLI